MGKLGIPTCMKAMMRKLYLSILKPNTRLTRKKGKNGAFTFAKIFTRVRDLEWFCDIGTSLYVVLLALYVLIT